MAKQSKPEKTKKSKNTSVEPVEKPVENSTKHSKTTTEKSDKLTPGQILNLAVLIFLVGCLLGAIGEEIYHGFAQLFATGQWEWSSRSGLIYGNLAPLYGVGALLVMFLLCLPKVKPWKCFLIAAILGGVYEYLVSFFQEKLFGTVSWNYAAEPLNINGRTSLIYMCIWGAATFAFVKWLWPALLKLYKTIPEKWANWIFRTLLVILIIDIILTIAAVARSSARHNDLPPATPIGVWLDQTYPDTRVNAVFGGTHFINN